MSSQPLVSVVMAVRDGERYLRDAIESVINQSYSNWELIVIDDESTDSSWDIIQSFSDDRIRPHKNAVHLGLAASLNRGIDLSKGPYVARMDGDDLCRPERLGIQVARLESDPDLGLLGSNYEIIDEAGKKIDCTDLFLHPNDLKAGLIVSNQLGHGTVIVRRTVLDAVGGYDVEAAAEDYDLWTRIARVAPIANLAQPLYQWRQHLGGLTVIEQEARERAWHDVRDREFEFMLRNRKSYKPIAPRAIRPAYLKKKSYVLRDLSYLSQVHGKRSLALRFMLGATLIAPWRKGNYLYLLLLLINTKAFLRRVPYVYA